MRVRTRSRNLFAGKKVSTVKNQRQDKMGGITRRPKKLPRYLWITGSISRPYAREYVFSRNITTDVYERVDHDIGEQIATVVAFFSTTEKPRSVAETLFHTKSPFSHPPKFGSTPAYFFRTQRRRRHFHTGENTPQTGAIYFGMWKMEKGSVFQSGRKPQ